ncbi:hypothetical protein [Bacillus velezensis]|uniref:hypothetical protein n=1 Tax=Bacillus velezensis TaxID=492670 RepID=UPI003EB935B9
MKKELKILKVSVEALHTYKNDVKRNYDIDEDQARRKLTRNVMLVKEFKPRGIKRGLFSKNILIWKLKDHNSTWNSNKD